MIEQALEVYDMAYGLKSVYLRCFSAAGSDPEGELCIGNGFSSQEVIDAARRATGQPIAG